MCRPTAESIWNTFLKSNKKHLILTGTRGIGKTTMLNKLLKQIDEPVPGLISYAEMKKAVWMKEANEEKTVQIGTFTGQGMKPVREGFETLGIPALKKYAQSDAEFVRIDEIGFLESGCETYLEAIRNLLKKKRVLAVLRKQNLPFQREMLNREDVFTVDLDEPFGNTGCVIMASGVSRRFGSNKLLAEWNGEELFHQVLKLTERFGMKRIVVTRTEQVHAYCKENGILSILHAYPARNDAVHLGLKELLDTDRCMFIPSDQPLLKETSLERLLLSAVHEPEKIWRTCFEDTPGAPVIFPRSTYEELLHLPEGKGGGAVVKMHPELVKMSAVDDRFELRDIDTPEDLAECRRYGTALYFTENNAPDEYA